MWSDRSSAQCSSRRSLAPSDSFSLDSVKARLLQSEERARELAEELQYRQSEIRVLQAEKETLQEVIRVQQDAARRQVREEAERVDRDMRAKFAHESVQRRMHQQEIDELRTMKLALQQEVAALQQRLLRLDSQIGS